VVGVVLVFLLVLAAALAMSHQPVKRVVVELRLERLELPIEAPVVVVVLLPQAVLLLAQEVLVVLA
jgi:hypothetical protein